MTEKLKKWIAYDDFEKNITWHDTQEEALNQLQININSCLDDENEWPDETEGCFVAQITHLTKLEQFTAGHPGGEGGIDYYYEPKIIEQNND